MGVWAWAPAEGVVGGVTAAERIGGGSGSLSTVLGTSGCGARSATRASICRWLRPRARVPLVTEL